MTILTLLFETAAEYVFEILPVMLLSGVIYLCWVFYRMFVPMGFLVPMVRKKDSFLDTGRFCLLTILAIELIQPFAARSFDTDDIVYNLIGAAIGFLCYAIIKKLCPNLISKCRGNPEANGIS